MITPECQRACVRLAGYIRYSLRVVQAWALAETSGGNNVVPATPYNYWNVGNTDSNPSGGARFQSPEECADYMYHWLQNNPASGHAILAASGKSDAEQINGLSTSPYSSSHYGPPGHPGQYLWADYNSLQPERKVNYVFDPPLQLSNVVDMHGYVLTRDGAVYAGSPSVYHGGANGKSYFVGREAAQLEVQPDGTYVIIDTAGERYGPVF